MSTLLPLSKLPSERRAAGAVAPSLSVVVLTEGDPSRLREWLAGNSRDCGRLGAEIVVCGPSAGLEEEFSSVSFVAPRAAPDPAALRREGMRRAGGDIVLFTDDGASDVAERLASLVSACSARPPSSPEG